MKVRDAIQQADPQAMQLWDGWDYEILAPAALDDEGILTVRLLTRHGDVRTIRLVWRTAVDAPDAWCAPSCWKMEPPSGRG